MKHIDHLFAPIFFVFVGLSLTLREIDWGSPLIMKSFYRRYDDRLYTEAHG